MFFCMQFESQKIIFSSFLIQTSPKVRQIFVLIFPFLSLPPKSCMLNIVSLHHYLQLYSRAFHGLSVLLVAQCNSHHSQVMLRFIIDVNSYLVEIYISHTNPLLQFSIEGYKTWLLNHLSSKLSCNQLFCLKYRFIYVYLISFRQKQANVFLFMYIGLNSRTINLEKN